MSVSDCQQEVNGLPILTGCPADTELMLVMNSTAAGNKSGYGLRYTKDLRQCFLAGLKFTSFQFVIGQGGSPMSAGDTGFIVTQTGILQDSVFITIGGPELPRDPIVNQISYGVLYDTPTAGKITVNFNNPASAGQLYIVHYAYLS